MNIIPKPYKFEQKPGFYRILPQTKIVIYPFSPELKETTEFLQSAFYQSTNRQILIVPGKEVETNNIHISLVKKILGKESYKLNVNARYIKLEAEDLAGVFYGIQSLIQLMPKEIHFQAAESFLWNIPVTMIEDKPRFGWRGMHLDVSRHFFDLDFIKRYIDLLAMHKLNIFHWHLTDDNGWRIEIKKYPKLTKIGAWRADRKGIDWRDCKPQRSDEPATYGGFYTQNEIKEIINYAAKRQITIVPEIEMPGHSLEALAAYTHLGCTGGPYRVATGVYWPNKDNFCAGNEEVFEFLENVLSEVIELFPSKYIHIGGDEAHKLEWSRCPKCQARMTEQGLENLDQLQSWFIKRIEKILISKGKKMIGWDEILEGGLAPEATVMSWRGEDGGIEAAKAGHDVVMSPGTHCYFDHYQADPSTEPAAIGGYTTLKKVYSYEPIPKELNAEEAKHVLGAQANVWTEWILDPKQAEYMILPRLCALAESVWSPNDNKDWTEFQDRVENFKPRLKLMNYNYCEGTYRVDIDTKFDHKAKTFNLELSNEMKDSKIHYTLDGSQPFGMSPIYRSPLAMSETTTIKAGVLVDGQVKGKPSTKTVNFHKAIGANISASVDPSNKYCDLINLTNGVLGSTIHSVEWSGFLGKDVIFEIDLNHQTDISSIALNSLQNPKSWIFAAIKVSFFVADEDKNFIKLEDLFNPRFSKTEDDYIQEFQLDLKGKYRYVMLMINTRQTCPPKHSAAGDPCWFFIDQIIIN